MGDEKTRGISGGEKKRLSIACQLFGTPALIFCESSPFSSCTCTLSSYRVFSVVRIAYF